MGGSAFSWKAAVVAAFCFVACVADFAAVHKVWRACTDYAKFLSERELRAAQEVEARALAMLQKALDNVDGDLIHLQAAIDTLAQLGLLRGNLLVFNLPGAAKALANARTELRRRAEQR